MDTSNRKLHVRVPLESCIFAFKICLVIYDVQDLFSTSKP